MKANVFAMLTNENGACFRFMEHFTQGTRDLKRLKKLCFLLLLDSYAAQTRGAGFRLPPE
jgi:hypothetical protein